MRMKNIRVYLFLSLLMCAASLAFAGGQISFQGKLTDSAGQPVTDNLDFKFRVYDAQELGSLQWTEDHDDLRVTDGLYSVMLGSVTSLSGIDFSESLWLEVEVENQTLSPRYRLAGTPFSFFASTAAYARDSKKLEGRGFDDLVSAIETEIDETDPVFSAVASTSAAGMNIRDGFLLSGTTAEFDLFRGEFEGEISTAAYAHTAATAAYALEAGSYAETDPVFTAHPSFGITTSSIATWDQAHSWGDHSAEGYLVSETDPVFSVFMSTSDAGVTISTHTTVEGILTADSFAGDISTAAYAHTAATAAYALEAGSYAETDPVFSSVASTSAAGMIIREGFLLSGTTAEFALFRGAFEGQISTAAYAHTAATAAYALEAGSYTETDPVFSVFMSTSDAGVSVSTNIYVGGVLDLSGVSFSVVGDTLSITGIDYTVLESTLTVRQLHTSGADLAEIFSSRQDLEPGDVVVIDPDYDVGVIRSSKPYDTAVAGIVSTSPGTVLGYGEDGFAIALAGRVPVKVCDEGGDINRGDLLTTSSIPGRAMKAANPQVGTVLGKALESFSGNEGVIYVLVALQ